jgi:hypothetical protein
LLFFACHTRVTPMQTIVSTVFSNGSKTCSLDIEGAYAPSKSSNTAVFETVFGEKSLHQTSKAKGCPKAAIGYIHDYAGNVLYAVSAMTSDKTTAGTVAAPWTGTLTIVAMGSVGKNKMHKF